MKKIFRNIIILIAAAIIFTGCKNNEPQTDAPFEIDGLEFSERVPNEYAEQFTIDRYGGGYSLICTMNSGRFLVVPENAEAPAKLDSDISVIQQPPKNFYVAATSAMGLFAELGCGNAVRFSSIKSEEWYIDYAKEAMENGEMLYAGKYREPDYEILLSGGCSLSVQSTMIEHSPDVKEKLTELGIPVFIDYSSYENHPLGRSEWIKVYGEICGKPEEAARLFSEQADKLKAVESSESTGKTAVFFYINTSGQAVTRKSGDYITKMIELAGGENVFKDLGDLGKASSAVTMEMEKFYTAAKDADFIIYNSTIAGEINSAEELIEKNKLLADFKAVKNGNVWCMRENLYQETMKLGTVISDLHSIFTENSENQPPQFLFKLESGEAE